MKINRNLLNLICQILEAQERSRNASLGLSDEWRIHASEAARLKDEAISEMIASAPFETTYNLSTAKIRLDETLEMFKSYKEEPADETQLQVTHPEENTAVRTGNVCKEIAEIQKEFESWADREGVPVDAARFDQCEDGRFPATYHFSVTETVWRAWASLFTSAQFQFEPVLYTSKHRLEDALASKQYSLEACTAALPMDVVLYRAVSKFR